MTADTVAVDTRAILATSLIVAAICLQQIDLAYYRLAAVARKALKPLLFGDKLRPMQIFCLRGAPDC
jgi:hypothetical protein